AARAYGAPLRRGDADARYRRDRREAPGGTAAPGADGDPRWCGARARAAVCAGGGCVAHPRGDAVLRRAQGSRLRRWWRGSRGARYGAAGYAGSAGGHRRRDGTCRPRQLGARTAVGGTGSDGGDGGRRADLDAARRAQRTGGLGMKWHRIFPAVLLLGLWTSLASAQDPRPRDAGRDSLEARVRARMAMMLRTQVGLDDEQIRRLQATNRGFEGQRRVLFNRERRARSELRAALASD